MLKKGIETYKWITGRVADSWMRSGTDSCDPFDLMVVISICELYNEYMLDGKTSPEDVVPLMIITSHGNNMKIALVNY